MKNTEKQLRQLQNIRMTEMERISMRTKIIAFIESTSPSVYQKIPSPFMMNFWSPVFVAMASIVFVIFGGSAVAYNASSSLPGDLLYNFKVHVNEEVAGIFIKSPLEKITFEQYRVAKRIEEVKKLATDGTLTAENAAIAEKNIDNHIAKIDESAKALAATDPKEFVEAAKGLEPILDAHEKDLIDLVETAKPTKEVTDIQVVSTENQLIKTSVINTTTETKANIEPTIETKKVDDKTPTIQKAENKVVDSIISKVQIESDILQKIAEPLLDKNVVKGVVKDTVTKTEVEKEIIPEATKVIQ
ncbi:hypothetical protein IT400_03790 [Candidatus Nomurabacteria bacterium]|nr:hypothetical protein [Candidatus Nomurabacteria bacterium]